MTFACNISQPKQKEITGVICQDKWTGAVSIYTCRISIGISITKIRRSNDCHTFIMVIPIHVPGRTVLMLIWDQIFLLMQTYAFNWVWWKNVHKRYKFYSDDYSDAYVVVIPATEIKMKSIHTRKYFVWGKMNVYIWIVSKRFLEHVAFHFLRTCCTW